MTLGCLSTKIITDSCLVSKDLKSLIGAYNFNKEKILVGAFSRHNETSRRAKVR